MTSLDGGYATMLTNSINCNAASMNYGDSDAMQPTDEAADPLAPPMQPQEEMYTPVRVLGKGAFGEAVLYRKTEVSYLLISSSERKLTFQLPFKRIRNINSDMIQFM